MKIARLMNVVDFASPDDSAQSLAELMGDLDVGAVPIGTADNVLGVVTDRDILFRVTARGLDPGAIVARDVMSAPVLCCDPNDELMDALDLMAAHQVRRLGVRAGEGPLLGWVTLSDISRVLLLESGTVATALAEITADNAA